MLADSAYPALLLNADFRPLCTYPPSVLAWKDAVRARIDGNKFVVVEEYDVYVSSPSTRIRLPSVIATRKFVDPSRTPSLTRWNVFLAHRFKCALCGERFPTEELTFEHYVPRSKGGKSTWDNLVPACAPCNGRKGDMMPAEAARAGIVFRHLPYTPTILKLNEVASEFVACEARATGPWLSWLYWKGVEIEP